jgi:hypothetical protein
MFVLVTNHILPSHVGPVIRCLCISDTNRDQFVGPVCGTSLWDQFVGPARGTVQRTCLTLSVCLTRWCRSSPPRV